MTTVERTVGDLEQLLREHGFVPGSRLGDSRRFVNKQAGATILLPLDPPADAVPVYAGNVRTHLDQLGLLDGQDFDEWRWRLKIARQGGRGRDAPAANGSRASNGDGTGGKRPHGPARDPASAAKRSRSSPRPRQKNSA